MPFLFAPIAYYFPMLANLLHFLHRRRAAEDYDLAFVEAVDVRKPRVGRSRRSETVLWVGWTLIAFKSVTVWGLIRTYSMPVNPWWIIAPTVVAAAVCTWLYVRRH